MQVEHWMVDVAGSYLRQDQVLSGHSLVVLLHQQLLLRMMVWRTAWEEAAVSVQTLKEGVAMVLMRV